MSLIQAHKVLISFAIVFFLFFGVREIYHQNAIMGSASLVITVVLVLYLRWVFKVNRPTK
ncbi:MAG: hypothetical protein ABI252_04300 [Candidatus Kapaibacterium sp.]|jgi:uncharacterized membrane protein (DUF2068 family)